MGRAELPTIVGVELHEAVHVRLLEPVAEEQQRPACQLGLEPVWEHSRELISEPLVLSARDDDRLTRRCTLDEAAVELDDHGRRRVKTANCLGTSD